MSFLCHYMPFLNEVKYLNYNDLFKILCHMSLKFDFFQNFLFFCKIVCNSSFSLDNSSLFALRLVAFLQLKVATWLMRILQGM